MLVRLGSGNSERAHNLDDHGYYPNCSEWNTVIQSVNPVQMLPLPS